jgi:DNA polymerase III subunit beta
MKFSVSKDKFLEGLSTVQNVVRTRTTLPILSNVLLQASDGEIRLTTLTWMSVFGGVLKRKLNEQGPRHYQPGGYFPSFANYRLLKSTSM